MYLVQTDDKFAPRHLVTNCTVASEIKIYMGKSVGDSIEIFPYFGGEREDVVSFFCKEQIEIISVGKLKDTFRGVIFRTEGDLVFSFGTLYSDNECRVYSRFITDGRIDIRGKYQRPKVILFSTKFAPPCPAAFIRLGRL